MSHKVGIRELRQQASALLKRVVGGEVIEVTDHGHPVARVVPIRADALGQMVLEGRATEANSDLLDLVEDLDLPASSGPGARPPSQVLSELRADER